MNYQNRETTNPMHSGPLITSHVAQPRFFNPSIRYPEPSETAAVIAIAELRAWRSSKPKKGLPT
jgi:hypothetical protein